MQRIAARDVPLIDLFYINYVTLANKRVVDHTTGAEGTYENFKVYLAK